MEILDIFIPSSEGSLMQIKLFSLNFEIRLDIKKMSEFMSGNSSKAFDISESKMTLWLYLIQDPDPNLKRNRCKTFILQHINIVDPFVRG